MTPEVYTLAYVEGTGVEEIRARVFGHLMNIARGYLVSYVSDLYHDAMWVRAAIDPQRIADKPLVFHYSVSESGTNLFYNRLNPQYDRKYVYRLTLSIRKRFEGKPHLDQWVLTIEQLAGEDHD